MARARETGSVPVLEVTDLVTEIRSVRGVVRPVDGVGLRIERGRVAGVVGESGSGKSMTAFSLLQLFPTAAARVVSGSVRLAGRELLGLPQPELRRVRGREIGTIFQDPASYLNPVLSIGHQLRQQLAAHGMAAEARRRIPELLQAVGLPPEVAGRFPHQLSGGQNQRVGIASALLCRPKLLIADEPTTALDVTIQAQILRLLRELQRENELAMLLITHDLGVVAEACDDVYVMYAGKVVEEGSVAAIFEAPQHPYTRGLLAGVLSLGQPKRVQVAIRGSVPDLARPPSGCRFHPRCPHAAPICAESEPPVSDLGSSRSLCWLHRPEYDGDDRARRGQTERLPDASGEEGGRA